MTKPKTPPEAKPQCDLCKGKGWFYTRSNWPAQCHRCFPNLKRPDSGPPRPAPKEYATGEPPEVLPRPTVEQLNVWADEAER